MSVVAFTAGSLGDILATAGIVIQVIQTLLQSSASRKQYRDVIDELKALHRVLLLANDVVSPHSGHSISRSIADTLKSEISECHFMMRSFLENISRYRTPLSTTGVRSLWGQVWWAIWEQDELEGLRRSIAARVQRMQVLLLSFNTVTVANISHDIRDGSRLSVARYSTPSPLIYGLSDQTWILDAEILIRSIERGKLYRVRWGLYEYDLSRRTPDPSNVYEWHCLGRSYMGGRQFIAAIFAYKQASELDNWNASLWCDIGRFYCMVHHWFDALNSYAFAVRTSPRSREPWICLGEIYYTAFSYGGLRYLDDAYGAFKRASEIDPSDSALKDRVVHLRKKLVEL